MPSLTPLRRTRAPHLLLVFLVAAAAFAPPAALAAHLPWDGPAFAAHPEALLEAAAELPPPADAEVEVLLYETEYTVEATGLTAYRERQLYRVLKPAGLEGWSSLEVPWSPWYQERPEIRARVIDAGGRARELEPSTVSEAAAPVEDPDVYGDERLLRAPLPAMAVGVLVETEIAVRHTVPYFSAGEVHRQWLAMMVPVRRSRLILDTPGDLEPPVRTHGVPEPRLETAGGRVRRIFELADVEPVIQIDPGLPPEVPLAPFVAFTSGRSWSDVARAYSQIVDRKVAAPEPDGSPLSGLLAGAGGEAAASQWERMQELLALIHREVRYTGLELDDGGVVPRTPHETLARRFGDCKDKAVLLVTLLRREGIPAYVALLNAGVGPDTEAELPGLGLFNHAIVYVPGGSPVWIDPTDPYTRLGELPPLDQGRLALVASPNTQGLSTTPVAEPSDNRTVETRDLYLADLGTARVVEASEMIGSPARELRASWDGAEKEEIRAVLEDYVTSTYGAAGITRFTYTPLAATGRELAVELEAQDAEYGTTDLTQAAALISVAPLFHRVPETLLETSQAEPRRHDFVLLEPYQTTWHYRIHIPPNLALRKLPEGAERRLGPATFRSTFELAEDGRRLDATFSFDSGKRRYTPGEVEDFRSAVRAMDETGEGTVVIWFDQTVQAHLDAGRLRQAVAEARRLVELAPAEALPRALLTRALLAVGLGEEARRVAAEAAALETEAVVGHRILAWSLVHDEVGRHFHRGFDRAGAEAAYRRALELAPEDLELLADLAILLEHDEEGVRYSSGADLDAAIELYHRAGEALAGTELADNLLVALLWAGRFEELRRELERLGDDDGRASLALAATAVLEGPEAAVQEAGRRLTEDASRVEALSTAARQLMLLRRYGEAAALFRGAGRGAPNPAALLSLAELVGRIRRHEEVTPSDDSPQAVVYAFFHALVGTEKPDLDRALELLAPSVRETAAEEEKQAATDFFEGVMGAVRSSGMPREVLADLVLSALETTIEGDDASGWRVEIRISVAAQTTELAGWVTREGEAFRLLSTEDIFPLGLEVLYRLEGGDLEGARAWLDRAYEADPSRISEDPLGGRVFLRFWAPGQEAGADRMRLAAVALLLESEDPGEIEERVIPALVAGREVAPEEERWRFDLALATAYRKTGELEALRDAALRLLAAEPGSDLALNLALGAQRGLGDAEGMDRLIAERLERDPKDETARRGRIGAALARGDLGRALSITEELLAGDGDPGLLNQAAWLALMRGEPSEEALKRARQGAERTAYRSRSILHTLASVYADLERPAEAYQVMLQAMELSGGEPLPADWYVFGRLAEIYGLPEVAERYYRRVERPESELGVPTSTWELARRRIDALTRTPKTPAATAAR